MFIYFWERERVRVTEGEWERGSEAGSVLTAASPMGAGSELTNHEIMTRAEVRLSTN